MKKIRAKSFKLFLLAVLAAVLVLALSGCSSSVVTNVRITNNRQVIQTLTVHFSGDTTPTLFERVLAENTLRSILEDPSLANGTEKTIIGTNDELVTFEYGKEFTFSSHTENFFGLTITFDNIFSYAYFNEIDLSTKRLAHLDGTTYMLIKDVEVTSSLFFRERTITMMNPFKHFFGSESTTRMGAIIDVFYDEIGDLDDEFLLIYTKDFTARRTSSNAYIVQRHIDGWRHGFVFAIDEMDEWKDIIIMDRFANTPIWYAIAVGATAIFMSFMWFILRPRPNRLSQNINQDNSTYMS